MVISAGCAGIGGSARRGAFRQRAAERARHPSPRLHRCGCGRRYQPAPGNRGGIGNTIIGLFLLGALNNGLDHVNIDSFLKILIRSLILLAALIINV